MWRIIYNNWQLKMVAVFISALFWYLIQAEEVLELNRKVHVHLHVGDGLLVRGTDTRIKDVTLSGPRALLAEFSNQPIDAHIRIPRGKLGELRFRVDREYIPNWNPRVKLTVHDAYLSVFVGEEVSKLILVEEQLQGTPAEGFIVEKTLIEPDKVKVYGLSRELAQIGHISTTPIDVDQLRESVSLTKALLRPDLPGIKLATERVEVELQVGEKKINRRFYGIPIEIEGAKNTLDFYPKSVSIEIQGTPGVLNLVENNDLKAFIDLREVPVGSHIQPIQVRIPADTVLIETSPDKVELVVQKIKKRKI